MDDIRNQSGSTSPALSFSSRLSTPPPSSASWDDVDDWLPDDADAPGDQPFSMDSASDADDAIDESTIKENRHLLYLCMLEAFFATFCDHLELGACGGEALEVSRHHSSSVMFKASAQKFPRALLESARNRQHYFER